MVKTIVLGYLVVFTVDHVLFNVNFNSIAPLDRLSLNQFYDRNHKGQR